MALMRTRPNGAGRTPRLPAWRPRPVSSPPLRSAGVTKKVRSRLRQRGLEVGGRVSVPQSVYGFDDDDDFSFNGTIIEVETSKSRILLDYTGEREWHQNVLVRTHPRMMLGPLSAGIALPLHGCPFDAARAAWITARTSSAPRPSPSALSTRTAGSPLARGGHHAAVREPRAAAAHGDWRAPASEPQCRLPAGGRRASSLRAPGRARRRTRPRAARTDADTAGRL